MKMRISVSGSFFVHNEMKLWFSEGVSGASSKGAHNEMLHPLLFSYVISKSHM